MLLKKLKMLFLAVMAMLFGLVSAPAMAAGAFDALTTAVTFTDVIAALMAVAAILAGLYVTMRGVRIVLGFIRRG